MAAVRPAAWVTGSSVSALTFCLRFHQLLSGVCGALPVTCSFVSLCCPRPGLVPRARPAHRVLHGIWLPVLGARCQCSVLPSRSPSSSEAVRGPVPREWLCPLRGSGSGETPARASAEGQGRDEGQAPGPVGTWRRVGWAAVTVVTTSRDGGVRKLAQKGG